MGRERERGARRHFEVRGELSLLDLFFEDLRSLDVEKDALGDWGKNVKQFPLVIWCAEKMWRNCQNPSFDFLDLVQEGMVGLANAEKNYDPDRGIKFITFAVVAVERGIKRFIEQNQGAARVPHRVQVERERVLRRLEESKEDGIPRAEIAEELGITLEDLEFLTKRLDGIFKPLSFESEVGRFDEEGFLVERIDDKGENVEIEVEKRFLQEKILSVIENELDMREAQIVKKYFGIGSEFEKNMSEIGREMGLSRERVRQILREALEKLKTLLSPDFRDYL